MEFSASLEIAEIAIAYRSYLRYLGSVKKLTARQIKVVRFLEDYQEEHGRAPTLQEICNHFGYRSLSSAQQHLRLIEQKGHLTRKPHCSRSIRIVKQDSPIDVSQMVAVPLVGKIAAGSPTFALEEVEEILALPKSLFRGRKLFALRVTGDSMVNAGIFDRDIAVLCSQPDFNDGDIAAIVLNEEATLKRLFRTPLGLRLHAENDALTDLIIPRALVNRSCRVAGVLVGTIRKFD